MESAIFVDALNGAGTLKGGYASVGSTTIGVAGGSGTFAGVIADSGDNGGRLGLIKAGAGLQILLGNNTYSGTTTISGGTLQIGSNTPTGSLGTGAVVNNGTLGFDRSDNATVANAISGAGGIAHVGGSTLPLTGANTYTAARRSAPAGSSSAARARLPPPRLRPRTTAARWSFRAGWAAPRSAAWPATATSC